MNIDLLRGQAVLPTISKLSGRSACQWVPTRCAHIVARFISLAIVVAGLAHAQTRFYVSYSPQGAEALKTVVGKLIKGDGLTQAVVCADGTGDLDNGRVYQTAVQNGLPTRTPLVAAATLARAAEDSPASLAVDGLGDLGTAIGLLGVTNVVTMPTQVKVGLTVAKPVVDLTKLRFSARKPQPDLARLLDPSAKTHFSVVGCVDALMVTAYGANTPLLLGPFEIHNPLPLPAVK